MNFKKIFADSYQVLKDTVQGFSRDKGLKLSGSLAYYTLFSLAPLLLLIISLAGLFFGKQAVEGNIFGELNGLLGNDAAAQVQKIIRNMELSGNTNFSLIISAATLIIGATTVFGELQDSINIIWSVKAKPKRGWLKLLKDRLLSGSLIIGLGFLLVVSLLVNGMLDVLNDLLKQWLPDFSVVFFYIASTVINLVVLSVVFAVIYKVLPDAKIKWRDVRAGAVFTTLLFMLDAM
ncbi:MAG: YihY/virulence factor BrkB family protein [Bacteroidia bacterium]